MRGLVNALLLVLCLFGAEGSAVEQHEYTQLTHARETAVSVPDVVRYRCYSVGKVYSYSGGSSYVTGTGTYIGAGLWLTNRHVVSGGRSFHVELKDGRKLKASLQKVDRQGDGDGDPDLALLATEEVEGMCPVPLAEDGPAAGDVVYPSGFDHGNMKKHYVWPARVGDTWGNGTKVVVGTDARKGSISGNSGGPVFNAAGELISPLWGNMGGDTNTGTGSTTMVCWRRTRFFLLPWRRRIMQSIDPSRGGSCPPGGIPPGSQGEPPLAIPEGPPPSFQSPMDPPPGGSGGGQADPGPPAVDHGRLAEELLSRLDYDKLATKVIGLMQVDDRFRGPQGPPGVDGRDGEPGPAGRITTEQVQSIVSQVSDILRQSPGLIGPAGPQGPAGEPGSVSDAEIRRAAEMAAGMIDWPDIRVVTVDGKTRRRLDEEVYSYRSKDHEWVIVLDLQNVINKVIAR